ncbi:hypothetical protein LCGC14_1510590 [marine sediment metagenome]|uniref:Uncharacterized protein n=1 Tax=marine sediment metagenome TaxID=412755 RepID=A0A0F9J1K2_9ZZZZ
MILMVVEALDHFSTEVVIEPHCIARFIGEYMGENDDYIALRHIKANIDDENSAEEIHKILKKAILRREILDLSNLDKEKKTKIWCTKCDIELKETGIALDCPDDGTFYECPTCNYRIVIFRGGV